MGLNVPAFFAFTQGGFHKLRRQDEVGRYPKILTFCQLLRVENVNLGGRWSKKAQILSTSKKDEDTI